MQLNLQPKLLNHNLKRLLVHFISHFLTSIAQPVKQAQPAQGQPAQQPQPTQQAPAKTAAPAKQAPSTSNLPGSNSMRKFLIL